MGKKFTADQLKAFEVLENPTAEQTPKTDRTHNAVNTQRTPKTPKTDKTHKAVSPAENENSQERLNLKIASKYKKYLKERAFEESSPENLVSVTEYLCKLIDADMKKH